MDEVQEKEEGTKILKRFVGKTKATRLAKDKNDSILGYVSSVSFCSLNSFSSMQTEWPLLHGHLSPSPALCLHSSPAHLLIIPPSLPPSLLSFQPLLAAQAPVKVHRRLGLGRAASV